MKELSIEESIRTSAGGDSFAYDLGQYIGGFGVGFALGAGQFPVAMLLGSILGTRSMLT